MNRTVRLFFVLLFSVVLLPVLFASTSTLAKQGDSWQLLADGKPFFIKGLTFGVQYDVATIDRYMDDIKSLGCNTIRTWGVGDQTGILLDSAEAHGIKVMLGLWLRHGRSGMEGDDAFDWVHDQAGRDAQWQGTLDAVKKYKGHPALLMWGVGNEVILNIATDEEKTAYCTFLEKICAAIKQEDPFHLISSASAWTIDAEWWSRMVPSIDIYGCNVYGGGAGVIAGFLKKLGVEKPYILTEFGAQGEWDVQKDANGIPMEPSDAEKYDTIAKGWGTWIAKEPSCLGAYVFNYGNGWDHGSVWLSLLMKDYKRPQYWASLKAFTGKEPPSKPVAITSFEIPASANPGDWVPVTVRTSGPARISLQFNHRKGSRAHRDAIFPLETKGDASTGLFFKAPEIPGALKIYAFASDSNRNLAIAQKSFVVGSSIAPDTVSTRGSLPLAVYDQDPLLTGVEPPFTASGLMGNYESLKLDYGCTGQVRAGRKTCLSVTWDSYVGWVGCAWQNPANNWGKSDGGYDLTGAKRLSFWARGDQGGEKVSFGCGLLGSDVPFRDSLKATTGDIRLTDGWKPYTIDLSGKNLTKIITGFVFFIGSEGVPVRFYLDDIRFE